MTPDEPGRAERALRDLRDRMVTGAGALEHMAGDRFSKGSAVEKARLQGKAEGVRLAMSYLDEVLRSEPTP